MSDYLSKVCEFVVGTDYDNISPEVFEQAKKVLYDTIGVIALGAQESEVKKLTRLLATPLPSGATLIGQKMKADPLVTALVNGTAGTWLELDEGNQYARGHAGIHVVPAALAVAEVVQASGKDLLTAIVLGYEVACRVGIACKLRMTMHPHGSWGTVGAACAVGKLMKVDEEQMKELINISSSLTLATSRRTMLEGGTVRNAYAGVSGYMGILAHKLLVSGFTGEADGLRSVFGTVVSDSFDAAVMTEELGSRYEIKRNYFKMHACCRYIHATLDALYKILERQEEGKLDPQEIEKIEVETYSLAAQLSSQQPQNMLAAKFSIPFSVATTIVNRSSGVESFTLEKVKDGVIRELAMRVVVTENPEFTSMMPSRRPSRITVKLKDGRTYTETVFVNRGDQEDSYSAEELERKFLSLTSLVYGPERAKEVLEKTKNVETFENVRYYTDWL